MNENDSPCTATVVTSEMVDCLSRAKAATEAKLSSEYQQIQTKLDAGEVKSLSRAQKLWTEYRDANCSAERDLYRGGTGAQPAYLGCMDAMARARLRDLQITYTVKFK